VITAHILRVANSPLYGFSNRVSTVSQAALLLGLDNIKLLLTGLLCKDSYGVNKIWLHSITTAIFIKAIQTTLNIRTCLPLPDLYTTAIIHDIGKVVLKVIFGTEYMDRITTLDEEAKSYKEEYVVFGIDHAKIGAYLLKNWRLPKHTQTLIEYHHLPHLIGNTYIIECSMLHTADILSLVYIYTPDNLTKDQILPISDTAWTKLGLTGEKIVEIYELGREYITNSTLISPSI